MGDKPKRPLSAFMIYMSDHRQQIKNDNPGSKITEIAKRGGELWRVLDDKSEWEQKAAEDKDRYTKEIKEFAADGKLNDAAPAAKKRRTKLFKQIDVKGTKKAKLVVEESPEDESD